MHLEVKKWFLSFCKDVRTWKMSLRFLKPYSLKGRRDIGIRKKENKRFLFNPWRCKLKFALVCVIFLYTCHKDQNKDISFIHPENVY